MNILQIPASFFFILVSEEIVPWRNVTCKKRYVRFRVRFFRRRLLTFLRFLANCYFLFKCSFL